MVPAGAVVATLGSDQYLLNLNEARARYDIIARELTKKFEEIARMPLGAAAAWLSAGPHRQQGEFVLVLAPAETTGDVLAEGQRVLAVLLESMPASEAARLAARISGAPKNALYRLALERSK